MSVRETRLDHLAGVVPGLPGAADLADVWLVHALDSLFDACDVPHDERARLVESGVDHVYTEAGEEAVEADALARVDACRRALAFSALGAEAGLNRVLRRCEPEWHSLARLTPAERYHRAPRLRDRLDPVEEAEFDDLVVEVFGARDELVAESGPSTAASPQALAQFTPARARAIVEASAEICCRLAALAAEDLPVTAHLVRETAMALTRRVELLSPHHDAVTNGDFPPYIGGS